MQSVQQPISSNWFCNCLHVNCHAGVELLRLAAGEWWLTVLQCCAPLEDTGKVDAHGRNFQLIFRF